MITAKEKAFIKATHGSHYATPIAAHLRAKGFTNKRGNPYSAVSVRMIVCGHEENENVLTEIIRFTAAKKAKLDNAAKTRKALMKK